MSGLLELLWPWDPESKALSVMVLCGQTRAIIAFVEAVLSAINLGSFSVDLGITNFQSSFVALTILGNRS